MNKRISYEPPENAEATGDEKATDNFGDTAFKQDAETSDAAEDDDETFTDGRAFTSAQNGRSGGRKTIPVTDIARDYVVTRWLRNGDIRLRFYKGMWYTYTNGRWKERHKEDIQADLITFLQYTMAEERISQSVVSDVMLNLKSCNLCYLDSLRYQVPCFIETAEPADAWIPTKNFIVNVEALAGKLNGFGADISRPVLMDQTPNLFTVNCLPYEYDETAQCPKWEKYLGEVQPNHQNREILQMLMGLALVPDCRYNVLFFLYGPPGTGKSVFVNVLEKFIGQDNFCSIPLSRLVSRFGLAPLTEKLLNIVGEMPAMPNNGKISDIEGIVKAITSGDSIHVERKFLDGHNARVKARMVFATNHLPDFSDQSAGVWERIRIIPFNVKFRGTEKQNPNLSQELLEELPGIFNWAVRGLAKLRLCKTFPESEEGLEKKKFLQTVCNPEQDFFSEFIDEVEGGIVEARKLYDDYTTWANENRHRPLREFLFKKALFSAFPKIQQSRTRVEVGRQVTVYHNIQQTIML
ncbi:MAG: phage/plasmid primase, P4 family [Victivallaceae bacterium]